MTVTDESLATLQYDIETDDALIATAAVDASDQVVISGVGAGDAEITVTVADAGGQSVQTVIPVTVTDTVQQLADAGDGGVG